MIELLNILRADARNKSLKKLLRNCSFHFTLMILYRSFSFQCQRIISTTIRRNNSSFLTPEPTRSYTSFAIGPDAKMSSLYNQSVPVMIKFLHNVSKILDKTVAYAEEKGLKHDEILTFRLREDMKPSVNFCWVTLCCFTLISFLR